MEVVVSDDPSDRPSPAPPEHPACCRGRVCVIEGYPENCSCACHRGKPQADKARPWNVARGNAPAPVGDCRKLVWLVDKDGMGWIGIRAYNHAEGAWWINAANGGREESATVTHWMNLPERPL